MIEILPINPMTPSEMYLHLEAHGLLTVGIKRDPSRLVALSQISQFSIWNDEDGPIALMIETPTGEPGCINLLIVPEDKTMGKRLWNDAVAIGAGMSLIWFEQRGLRRVQAFVPESRVNMQRIMRAMGFVEETRRKLGLRGYFDFGDREPQAAQVWSLMPGDPVGKDHISMAETI